MNDWLEVYRWISVLFIVLGLPLALSLVPINHVYGVRTRSSLASRERWYAENRYYGRLFVALGAGHWLIAFGASRLPQAAHRSVGLTMLSLMVLSVLVAVRQLKRREEGAD